MNPRRMQVLAWSLSVSVALIAIFAWAQGLGFKFTGLGFYQIFPVFGLLAYSLMWAHYVSAATRLYFKIDRAVLVQYFEITGMVVLASILLHPGLLAWQAWRDGMGLPPSSQIRYVAPMLGVYVVIGIIAYIAFLSFELRRKFGARPWFKYISYASDIGMFLIILHSLKLGSHLQIGWFRTLWYLYGVTYFIAVGYIYYLKFAPKPKVKA